MSSDAKELVVAFFDDPDAGVAAVRRLTLARVVRRIRGTVGLLALGAGGNVRLDCLGARSDGDGPGVGSVLGSIALAIAGGVLPRRSHFFDSDSNLTTDDVARIAAHLDAGQSLVAVLCGRGSGTEAIVVLTEMGGRTETHRLSRHALWTASGVRVL